MSRQGAACNISGVRVERWAFLVGLLLILQSAATWMIGHIWMERALYAEVAVFMLVVMLRSIQLMGWNKWMIPAAATIPIFAVSALYPSWREAIVSYFF